MSNESIVRDHPGRLGKLAEVFVRRKIGFAVDANGELVLVRPDSVVVDLGDPQDEESFGRALDAITRYDDGEGARIRRAGKGRGGLVAVRVPNGEAIQINGESRWSVEPVQQALDRLRGGGARSEANHVVLGSQAVTGSPVGAEANYAGGMMFTAQVRDTDVGPVLLTTSQPAPEPAWLPRPLALDGHAAPRVLILDTGLRTTGAEGTEVEHEYLTCARLHSDWLREKDADAVDDEDEYDSDRSGTLDFEAGHGTFITGIVQQICPDAEVHIAGVLSSFGDGDVATVIAAFEKAVSDVGEFDIVIMSLGGYLSDDDAELFGASLDRLLGDGLGVAAAGNQLTSRPYHPAALPQIVGVGGLAQNDRAWFSNFGGWVDACAPAVDVVSTFFRRTDDGERLDHPFTGWARWSGTSFAAPKVAAVIAREMYLTGERPKVLWKRLSDYRRYRFPDLGIVFNV